MSPLSIKNSQLSNQLLSGRKQPIPNICIHELFIAGTARTSKTIALMSRERPFTYFDVDQYTNRLARVLQFHGVSRETIVGCHISDTPTIILFMLAIWKAGGDLLALGCTYAGAPVRVNY